MRSAAILNIYGKELGSILLRPNYSGFKRIQKFPLCRADSKSWGFLCRIHRIRVDGARSERKKLWIIKFLDKCGRSRRLKCQDTYAIIYSFLCKEIFYKNIEAAICEILRITLGRTCKFIPPPWNKGVGGAGGLGVGGVVDGSPPRSF